MEVKNSAQLEEAFGQFIEFGKVFDIATRRFLVQYIHAKIYGKTIPKTDDKGKYFEYLKESLDKIFDEERILEATSQSPQLTEQLVNDILRWLRNTDRKVEEENPHYEEKQRFDAWSHKPTFLWKESWHELINYLRNEYDERDLATDFYADKFKELMPQAPNNLKEQELLDQDPQKSTLDVTIDDLLAQWDALLSAKILKYQLEQIDKERELFCELLYAKVEEFLKLISIVTPIAMEAGRFWDMSRGLWKDTSFNVLDQYSQLLENEKSIQELADMLGKMREAEIELEEETFENIIIKKEWIKDERLKEEVNGVHNSNNLNTMLPSEAALLADGDTEMAFYQKFAHQDLLSFKYEGRKLVTSDKILHFKRQKQKRKEKGPFILCLDTSGSMHGLPSQIAKVLTFAIMKMAAKEQRKCYLISFSIGIKSINLLDLANSMDKIVEFLMMSFDGGTDVTPALSEALTMLQTNDYKEADVLMVSDFVMFEIRQEILQRIKREQVKDTKFHSLTIGKKANPEVLEAFDNCWMYDPEQRGIVEQLTRDIQQISDSY